MTLRFPRRVRDLLIDYDEESNTPLKTPLPEKNEASKTTNENKENDKSTTQPTIEITNTKCNIRNFPRRRSELMQLDSDSEEDESSSNNFNCAILNDSFLLSPNNETKSETCNSSKTAEKADTNISLLSKFDNMGISSKPPCTTGTTNEPANSSKQLPPSTTTTRHCTLQTIAEQKAIKTEHNKHETPMRATTLTRANSAFPSTSSNSTMQSEQQFVTPQVRAYSVQRRPRTELCSTQTQKSRAAIANEFRSQKVLFQTPMSVARTLQMPNDSITLSLCDTINEGVDTPNTAEKEPEVLQKPQHVDQIKSKKSLDGAFAEAEKHKHAAEKPKAIVPSSSSTTASATSSSSSTTSTKSSSRTVLHINDSDYTIIKKLGCGGSSSVYLAESMTDNRECALKVVDLQGDPAVVEGYLNETKLLAKLQGNICVVSLYEYQLLRKEFKLYLVMEKGDSDLNKILQSYTTELPLYVLMNYLYQMIQAVNYIHQNGVIHSDLKPANFLMVRGRLKLIDFGIASNIAIDSTSIIKFSQAGTFNYISPEALTDTSTGSSPMRSNQPKIKISTKSDVWSLGCILYLLLYQKTPFSHIKNIYAKISAISNPSTSIEYPALPIFYPAMLLHMAKNCLQHNPKKRPACADLLQYPFNKVIPIQNLLLPANTNNK